jgi:site-specific DNA-methyltransferase (cytosine-N4-specific)
MRALFAELRRVLADDGTLWLNLGDSYATHDLGGYRQGEHLNPGGRQAAKGSGRNRAGTKAPGIPAKNLLGIPWRVAFALQDDGWILRNAITWHKPNAMPQSVRDRLNCRYEQVFMFSKSQRYWFDLDSIRTTNGANPGDVWAITTQPFPGAHFATFPQELPRRCSSRDANRVAQCSIRSMAAAQQGSSQRSSTASMSASTSAPNISTCLSVTRSGF